MVVVGPFIGFPKGVICPWAGDRTVYIIICRGGRWLCTCALGWVEEQNISASSWANWSPANVSRLFLHRRFRDNVWGQRCGTKLWNNIGDDIGGCCSQCILACVYIISMPYCKSYKVYWGQMSG